MDLKFLLYDHQSYIDHPILTIIIRLTLSMLIGIYFGWERRSSGQPAGIRTFSVVTISSTLLMLFSSYQTDISLISNEAIRIDPTRMAQGIMTGIGFLGAGLLVKESFTIRGITTASMIWLCAALGILIGIGFFAAAIYGSIMVIILLKTAKFIEGMIPVRNYAHIVLVLNWSKESTDKQKFLDTFRQYNVGITRVNESMDLVNGTQRLSFYANFNKNNKIEEVKSILLECQAIKSFDIHYKN